MKNKSEQAEQAASETGKFDSVADLLSAYNALETALSEREKQISELRSALAAAQSSGQSDVAPPAPEPVPEPSPTDAPPCEQASNTAPVAQDTKDPAAPDAAAADKTVCVAVTQTAHAPEDRAAAVLGFVAQNIAELAESLCELPELMDACIARYKQRLLDGRLAAVPRGAAVLTPAKRPKTLTDAKRVADALLAGG